MVVEEVLEEARKKDRLESLPLLVRLPGAPCFFAYWPVATNSFWRPFLDTLLCQLSSKQTIDLHRTARLCESNNSSKFLWLPTSPDPAYFGVPSAEELNGRKVPRVATLA